jgi:hypothetical protein
VWFRQLFGFEEGEWADTRARFRVEGEELVSVPNGRRFAIGRFDTPSLGTLRAASAVAPRGELRWSHEAIGDVLGLHALPENAGAMFQVASQFNCLEFPGPETTPEHGVTGYASDPTQGPACSLAAAAATVYRNYHAPCRGGLGQQRDRQIDNLEGLSELLDGTFYTVRNGYTHATADQLRRLHLALSAHPREHLLAQLRIGVQTRVGVTFAGRWSEPSHVQHVSQAFCSAVSCGYVHGVPLDVWEPLATLVLDAAYEATLHAAAVDLAEGRGSGRVWLTFVGGGVFGNRRNWIADAIRRALTRCADLPLDVRIAHYRSIDEELVRQVDAG